MVDRDIIPRKENEATLQGRLVLVSRSEPILSVCGFLVRDAIHRAFLRPDSLTSQRFYHLAGSFRIVYPLTVELVRAFGDTAITVTRIDHTGVAAVHQFEEVVV